MGSKEGITRWVGRGQLEPGSPGSAGAGVGGEGAPSFIKRRLPHSNSSGNDLKLLQNRLIILFSRPFCIVWMFFKTSMGSFENEKKQLSYFHFRDSPPRHPPLTHPRKAVKAKFTKEKQRRCQKPRTKGAVNYTRSLGRVSYFDL